MKFKNIFSKNSSKEEVKSFNINPSNFNKNHESLWLENTNYEKMESIYRTNPIIFRSIHLISECANSMKITTHNKEINNYLKENFGHIIRELLIHGNCFLHQELFIIPVDRVTIETNKNNNVTGYKIDNRIYNTEEILHLKYCGHNGYKLFGISAIQVCAPWVEIYKFIQNYMSGMMQYGGKPSGILSYTSIMNEKDRITLKEQFRDLYANVNNGGGVILTSSNISWQPIGMEPEKLHLLDNLKQATKEIANCFGVPAILLGATEQATFSNYTQARKQLWEDVVTPLATNLIEKISQFLNINIHLNSQNNAFLNEKLWENNILTLNEKRALLGYDKIVNLQEEA